VTDYIRAGSAHFVDANTRWYGYLTTTGKACVSDSVTGQLLTHRFYTYRLLFDFGGYDLRTMQAHTGKDAIDAINAAISGLIVTVALLTTLIVAGVKSWRRVVKKFSSKKGLT
jgi:hypothetical protein